MKKRTKLEIATENSNLRATINSLNLTVVRLKKEVSPPTKCIHGVAGEGVVEIRRSNCFACEDEREMEQAQTQALVALQIRADALEHENEAFERLHHHAIEDRDQMRKDWDQLAGWLPLILDERARQEGKWGQQNHNDYYWLGILFEEAGEVAKALIENCERADPFYGVKNSIGVNLNIQTGTSDEAIRKELSHVAAVAVAWIDAMNRRQVV